jgi:hypothetical protein
MDAVVRSDSVADAKPCEPQRLESLMGYANDIAHGTQKIIACGGEDLVGQRSVRGYDRPRQHKRSHHLRIEWLWRARAATPVSSSLFFGQTFRHFVTRFDSWIAEYAIEMIVDSELLRRKCRCCGVTQIFQQFMAQSTFGNRNSRPHLREPPRRIMCWSLIS